MPSTFLEGLENGLGSIRDMKKRHRDEKQFQIASRGAGLDEAVKRAQLGEMGYQIGNTGGNQFSLNRVPGYVGKDDLQRKKLELEIEDAQFKNDYRKKMTSGAQFGQAPSGAPVQQDIVNDQQPNQSAPTFKGQKYIFDPYSGSMKSSDEYKIWLSGEEKRAEENVKREMKQKEDEKRLRVEAEEMLSTIDEVKKGMKHFGMFGNLPSIPGSERKNWEVNVNKLMAEKVLKVMSDLKRASATGSTGFGQLNRSELQLLKDAATALKKDLSQEDAQRYLAQIEAPLRKALTGQGVAEQSTEQKKDTLGIL